MDFMYWLYDRFITPDIPITALFGILILFGFLFGIAADPVSTILGFSSWVGLMYHLYTRE